MLNFEPFSIDALIRALPFVKKNQSLCSDLSAGYLFMWHEDTDARFCVWNDTFSVRENVGEQPAFSYPIGADPSGMIDELKKYAYDNRLPLRFFAVDDNTLEKILGDERLRPAAFGYDRRWSDYIYSFEEAATFKGKKYAGQRNHINKFRRLYGDPLVRFLSADDRAKVSEMLDEYEKEHPDGQKLEKLELIRTKELFDTFGALGLFSAGIFIEGKIAAFSIGEIVGDTLLIHVEKALKRYEGAYPAMYSGFVRLIEERLNRQLRLVNREDDSGDPGIRTSKTQYHPVRLAHKYLVHVNSPAIRSDPAVAISSGNIVLTRIRESDKPAYLKLNTDVANNRYWGYDYREDVSVSLPVDENTFYDLVEYDMRAGDSVNFAVRLSENGEMIGEAVLWNFTSDGFAELGCRILPEYQGKGYGRSAFGAAADYAVRSLNVKVYARCYKNNAPSYRMIAANGFTPVRGDDDFYYFERE